MTHAVSAYKPNVHTWHALMKGKATLGMPFGMVVGREETLGMPFGMVQRILMAVHGVCAKGG